VHLKCEARDYGPDEGKNRNRIAHGEDDASRQSGYSGPRGNTEVNQWTQVDTTFGVEERGDSFLRGVKSRFVLVDDLP
jgi:hypothetical protein